MREIELKESRLVFGNCASDLRRLTAGKRYVLIVDEEVWRVFGGRFVGASEVIRIRGKEAEKDLRTVEKVYRKLMGFGIDRYTYLIGVGGGVVLDVAGFAASTFMRGVPFGFVPTTLLAQVDASFGGKNGINFSGIKNLIGTINHPEFILVDLDFLATLPEKEWGNGIAEIIKHGIVVKKDLFEALERVPIQKFRSRAFLERIILDSILAKAEIVRKDVNDFGERRKLNFGHTAGHAIEASYGLSHGQAVAVGMVIEANLSVQKGFLSFEDFLRIKKVLEKFGLPTSSPRLGEEVMRKIGMDKKRENVFVHMVFIKGIGCSSVERITIGELREALNGVCEHR